MATDNSQDNQISGLTKQVEILKKELELVKVQAELDAAKQNQQAQLNSAVADALKNQLTAQYNLESEKAKLPLAELAGIKAALGTTQLPTGQSGTVKVAAGTAGTALLRSKGPMLMLLDSIAEELKQQLPNGAVIVNEAQLDQAYQADFTRKRVTDQTEDLKKAIEAATPPPPVARPMGIAPVVAAVYSLGFVLDTVNSFAKLFRVDRKVDVFATDTEALQMLGYMLEGKASNFVANPALIRGQALTEANNLATQLSSLHSTIYKGDDLLGQLKKIEEEEAKTKPDSSQLPAANVVTELKAQIDSARSLLDGLHPNKKPEVFWTQVKGQLISEAMKDRDRLLLEAKSQAIQITETRTWRSDRLSMCGEVQVAYRILDKDGKIKKTGVFLKASKVEGTSFNEMSEFSFPGK